MHTHQWPDRLQKPDPQHIEQRLQDFWQTLAPLGELIAQNEHLLAAEQLVLLRRIVLELMLALNGIQRPESTLHLNNYLGESQRLVLEKSLLTPEISGDAWIGQAVALVVIYRWYAPQLVETFNLIYPQRREEEALMTMQEKVTEWPRSIETE